MDTLLINPPSKGILIEAALDYYDKKNNSKAIELLDKIIKKYPEFQAAKIARSKIK
jgi:TolA-binding protein